MVPRVTVVLPVFNAASTIGAAIASIRAQTYAGWELLIVDDGSSDGTRELVAAAARQDSRVRVLGHSHAGLVGALNAGMAAARGEFIARMDADDESYPDRLAAQVERLASPCFARRRAVFARGILPRERALDRPRTRLARCGPTTLDLGCRSPHSPACRPP